MNKIEQVVMAIVSLALFNAVSGVAQPLLRRTLTAYLEELSELKKERIAFSPSVTDVIFPLPTAMEGSVEEVLNRLLRFENLDYKVVGEVYVVYFREKAPLQKTIVPQKRPVDRVSDLAVFRHTWDTSRRVVAYDTLSLTRGRPVAFCFRPEVLSPSFEREVVPAVQKQPRWGIKTNLLHDATASIHLGAEAAVAPRWSLGAAVGYNGWAFADNRKWKHFMLQFEANYWIKKRFDGHFAGTYLHTGVFNVGGLPAFGGLMAENMQTKRYEGNFYGIGVSYGYRWSVHKHWGIEPAIGVGYARIRYEKFACQACGVRLKTGTKNYFGPTKLAVSLIYSF